MIKKHLKRYIYASYQITFWKQLQKKTFEPTEENADMKENLC